MHSSKERPASFKLSGRPTQQGWTDVVVELGAVVGELARADAARIAGPGDLGLAPEQEPEAPDLPRVRGQRAAGVEVQVAAGRAASAPALVPRAVAPEPGCLQASHRNCTPSSPGTSFSLWGSWNAWRTLAGRPPPGWAATLSFVMGPDDGCRWAAAARSDARADLFIDETRQAPGWVVIDSLARCASSLVRASMAVAWELLLPF